MPPALPRWLRAPSALSGGAGGGSPGKREASEPWRPYRLDPACIDLAFIVGHGSEQGTTIADRTAGPGAQSVAKQAKSAHTEPKYPYTNVPGVLRKILQAIPGKPKPAKLDPKMAVSWGTAGSVNSNLRSAVSVLKKVGLIASSGEPTSLYNDFMNKASGPVALGNKLREVYSEIFSASHAPQNDGDEALETLFNQHAGGSENVVRLQIQTFKALCDSASFSGTSAPGAAVGPGSAASNSGAAASANDGGPGLPPVKIDLHIHLPENKTTRDYEAIIQDIAKYIYGRGGQAGG